MPVYHYECRDCHHEFEDQRTIQNRKIPTEQPCPNCKALNVFQHINAPSVCYRIIPGKPTSTFRNRLKEIDRTYKGGGINSGNIVEY